MNTSNSRTKPIAFNAMAGAIAVAASMSMAYGQVAVPVTRALEAHFDAAAGTTTDGNGVTTWLDQSGNDHTATRNQGTMQIAANAINSRPVVQFRGNAYANMTGNLFSKQQYVVFKLPNSGDWGSVMGNQTRSGYLMNRAGFFWDGNYPAGVRQNGGSNLSPNYQLSDIGNFMVVKITGNNNDTSVRSGWALGRQEGWGSLDMDLAEVIAYGDVLTTEEENLVGGYLTWKYALTTGYPAWSPSAVVWAAPGVASVGTSSANVSSTMSVDGDDDADVMIYWGTSDAGATSSGWSGTPVNLANQAEGLVAGAIPGLTSNTVYYFRFYGIKGSLAAPNEAFSSVGSFRTAATDEWTGAGNDLWSNPANWASSNVPDTAGETARFKDLGVGGVDLNGSSFTLGTLTFEGGGYNLLDDNLTPGSLTAGTLLNSAGTNTVDVGMALSGVAETTGGTLKLLNLDDFSASQLKLNGGTLVVQGAGEMTSGPLTWDFESGDLTGWHDVGTSHGADTLFKGINEPVSHGRLPKQGTWYVDGYASNQGNADGWTGILESDSFILGANCQFSLIVGGGNFSWSGDPDAPVGGLAGVALEREVSAGNWENIFWASGGDNNLTLRNWNASAYEGETVRLRIYDTHTGGWGWTAVDNIQATAAIIGSAGPIDMTAIPVSVTSDSTLSAITAADAVMGALTVANNATLTTTGNALSFLGTTIPAAATAAGFSPGVDTYLTHTNGLDGSNAAVTLTKTGAGNLILDKAGSNLGNATFDVQAGKLGAVHTGAFGGAILSINGGTLVLSSPGGDPTYAKSVTMASGGTLSAGKIGGGVDGPQVVTLSGDVNLNGQTLAVTSTDNHTLKLGGEIVGSGTLNLTTGTLDLVDDSFSNLQMTGGTLLLHGGLTVESLNQTGGSFSGLTGDLTVINTLALSGASIDMSGKNLVLTTANVTLSNSANVTYDQALTVGSMTINGGTAFSLGDNALTAGSLTINSGGTLSLGSSALDTGTFVLRNGGTLNTTGTITASSSMSFWPERTIANQLSGAGDVNVGYGPEDSWGYLALTGANDYSGATRIGRGALRVVEGVGLPVNSRLIFAQDSREEYGVVETSGTFARNIGQDAGEVHWQNQGGFSALGGSLTVTLEGGAELDWSSGTGGFNNSAGLQFGSPYADGMVEVTNPINLNSNQRNIQVCNNPAVKTDFLRLSGVISGNGSHNGSQLRFNENSGNGFYNSLIELTGENTYSQRTLIDYAAVYAVDGAGLPAGSTVYFEGNDVWEEAILLSQGTLDRLIGNDAAGQVYWGSHGGFAARGGNLEVTLEGGATLDWGSDSAGFRGQWLQMGSMYADNLVELTNAINLAGNRPIIIFDNPDTDQDVAKLSGIIGGSGNELRKYGNSTHRAGTLWLSGENTFNGRTFIDQGVIRAVDGVGLPTASQLYFEADNGGIPAVFESSGSFTRNIDNSGGSVYWGESGGFAAWGGPLEVTLEGGVPLLWDNSGAGFNNRALHLGSQSANDVVTMANTLDTRGGWRQLYVWGNPYSETDGAVLNDLTSTGGTNNGHLQVYGDGILRIEGTTTNMNYLRVEDNATVLINGTFTGLNIDSNNGQSGGSYRKTPGAGATPTIGGGGTINANEVRLRAWSSTSYTTLAPGASAGTLTANVATGFVLENNNVTYEWELGAAASDKVAITGNLNVANGWRLKLLSVGGTPLPATQYDLFTYTGTGSYAAPVIDSGSMPADWRVDNLTVVHDTVGKRVYLTGLYSVQSVANAEATLVTSTSATLNGFVSADDTILNVTVYWGESDGGTDPNAWDHSASVGTVNDLIGASVSHPVTGLSVGIPHFHTFRATDGASLDLWAAPSASFATLGTPVVNNAAGAVAAPGASTLRGSLTAGGSADVTVYWGTTDGGTTPGNWQHSVTLPGTPQGDFETVVAALYGYTYYYRSYASNEVAAAWAPTTETFAPPRPLGGFAYQNGLRGSMFQTTPDNSTPMDLAGAGYEVSFTRVFTGAKANTVLAMTPATSPAEVEAKNSIIDNAVAGFGEFGGPPGNGEHFVTALSGTFFPPTTGSYHFRSDCDDRAWLWIDQNDNGVFDTNENVGSYDWHSQGSVTLTAGVGYNFMHFSQEHGGGESLNWYYTPPGGSETYVNPTAQAGQWRYATGLEPGVVLTTTAATGVTHAAAVLNATLECSGSGWDVTAYWGTADGGTDTGSWQHSAPAGSWENDPVALIGKSATGLSPNTTYYFTFRATNPEETIWSAASLSFTTEAGGSSPYDTWAGGTFENAFTDTEPAEDQDGDTHINLMEYAFGTDPTVNSSSPIVYVAGGDVTTPGQPLAANFAVGSGVDFRAVFGRRKDYLAAGLTYTVQFSATMDEWVDNTAEPSLLTGEASAGDIDAVSVPFPLLIETANGPRQPTFFRVGISQAE